MKLFITNSETTIKCIQMPPKWPRRLCYYIFLTKCSLQTNHSWNFRYPAISFSLTSNHDKIFILCDSMSEVTSIANKNSKTNFTKSIQNLILSTNKIASNEQTLGPWTSEVFQLNVEDLSRSKPKIIGIMFKNADVLTLQETHSRRQIKTITDFEFLSYLFCRAQQTQNGYLRKRKS